MQFFPHIESGNSSALSSSAGFFADKPTGEGFASFLSSHLDEHGMHGGDPSVDQSVSHAQTQDSPESAPSLPDSTPSDFESETGHESSATTYAATSEDALEHEISASDKEMVHSEFSAGDQKEVSANSAASDARRKDAERGSDSAGAAEKHGEDAGIQDPASLLRSLESLLDLIRQGLNAGAKSQAQGESIDAVLGQLRKLADAVRNRMAAAGEDAGKSVRSKLEQIKISDLDAVQDKLREILGAVKNTTDTLLEGKGGKSTGRKPSLEVGADKQVSLSAQERELLQEVLAKLESIKAQLFGKEEVRPASKAEAGAKVKAENKTIQMPGTAEIAAPGVQGKTQAVSASVNAVAVEKSAGQDARLVAKGASKKKTKQTLPSGVREVAAQSAQSRPVSEAVTAESAADPSGKEGSGKFFRESASKDSHGFEEKISAGPAKLDPVASRETPDGGRLQQTKMPDTTAVFTAQSNAAGSLHTSGPAVKSRSAEVYRQVEAGAFRDLGQGNKQLVIRLDPPDLGQVSVILQVRGKEVRAVLRTTNQEASQALSEQLGQLRSRLESQGLQVNRLEVQTQLADSQTESQWQGAEQHNRYQENRELAMTAQRLRSLGRVESPLAQDMQNIPHKENISPTGVDIFA